ncbi:MAG TPA: PQQ-binding-like beta-propeller repeat protein [Leptospiraceae bacterium]|nr:PQQ-binding-like beta-propeller repeat protein [Leptospiraceae bacterium]
MTGSGIFRFCCGLVFCASVLFLSACSSQVDWIEYRGKNGSGGTANALHPPLGLRWKLRLQDETGKEAKAFNPPVVIGDMMYFGSIDGNFYALDTETGYMKWNFKTRGAVNSVPFADDQAVYFGSNDGSVYAVDLKDGKQRWSFPTGNTVQSLVLRYKDNIIFTSDTGATFFLDLNGHEQQRLPNPVWSHHTFQVYEGVVYWAPRGRSFGAYDMATKQFLWSVDVTVPYAVWYSFPAIDSKQIYYSSSYFVGGDDPVKLTFYAHDRLTGEATWQNEDSIDMGGTPPTRETVFMRHVQLLDYLAPALYKDLVIYTSGDSVVRAFDTKTGSPAWRKNLPYATSSAVTVAGDRIYFGMRGDEAVEGVTGKKPKLICMSARDGNILWQMDTEGAILSSPVISGKRIMFGTDKNYFYVLEEIF